jgi:hypothetical protein
MNGIYFYFKLRVILQHGEIIGITNRYSFIRWMENGNLEFAINENQKKSIPAEIIIAAFYARGRRVGQNPPIIIDDGWVIRVGQDNWCFDEVLNALINNYGDLS